MSTNKYFTNAPSNITPEQLMVDNWITEAIQINGTNCYYILRDSQTSFDYILGEDPTSMFQRAYLIEMYLDNPEGSVSGGDLLAKFGLQITDSSNFVIGRRAFERYIPGTFRKHPLEGDLIYVPMMNQTFEIKKVEEEQNFYTLGKRDPYFYNLKTQTFQFSEEVFDTGIDEVDAVQSDNAQLIQVPLSDGSIDYQKGETVYQGTSLTTATATGVVDQWFPSNTVIHIYNRTGVFTQNARMVGATSGANWIVGWFDDRTTHSRYDFNSNEYFIDYANTIIDSTVTNVFGNPGPQDPQAAGD